MSPDTIRFDAVGHIIQSTFNTMSTTTVHYSMVYECEVCAALVRDGKLAQHRTFHKELNKISIGV